MIAELTLIDEFKERLERRTLSGSTIFKIGEYLYGCIYQNEIFIMRHGENGGFVLYEEYNTLEDYFVSIIGSKSKPLFTLLQGIHNTSLIYDYINQCDRLRICNTCGNIMTQGYCFEEAAECYCNTICLNQELTPDECLQYIEDDSLYWTQWS